MSSHIGSEENDIRRGEIQSHQVMKKAHLSDKIFNFRSRFLLILERENLK